MDSHDHALGPGTQDGTYGASRKPAMSGAVPHALAPRGAVTRPLAPCGAAPRPPAPCGAVPRLRQPGGAVAHLVAACGARPHLTATCRTSLRPDALRRHPRPCGRGATVRATW